MTSHQEWIQVGLFLAGAAVHFLYTRLSASPAPTSSPTGVQDPVQALASIANKLIEQQVPPPAQAPDTATELLALLHKVVDQNRTATPTPAAPTVQPTTQIRPSAS
jgi:hypothetical protein